MARKKDITSTVRWTEKNLVYLTKLGYLDGRSGRKKSEVLSLNEFINQCVTVVLEENRLARIDTVTDQSLILAWARFQKKQLGAQVEPIMSELRKHIALVEKLEAETSTEDEKKEDI